MTDKEMRQYILEKLYEMPEFRQTMDNLSKS